MVTVANDRAEAMRDLPARRALYGLPVRALVHLPSLRGTRVLAGTDGLDREVRRVNVMEVPDILPWVTVAESHPRPPSKAMTKKSVCERALVRLTFCGAGAAPPLFCVKLSVVTFAEIEPVVMLRITGIVYGLSRTTPPGPVAVTVIEPV